MMQGTRGTLSIDRAGYEIIPRMEMHSELVTQASREAYDDLTGLGQF